MGPHTTGYLNVFAYLADPDQDALVSTKGFFMQSVRPARLRPITLALTLLAAAWLPTQAQARAQFSALVTPTVTPGSPNTYAYTLTDGPTGTIAEFDLTVPATAALTNVGAPAGWLALYTTGDTSISWMSTDSSTDIKPLTSLSGFRFQSALPPGPETYLVQSIDTGESANGTTLGPSTPPAVPEASTTVSLGLLLALGMGGLVVAGKRKKSAV